MSQIKTLNQYFTPSWAAAALVRQHFSDLSENDFVVEPMCGPGRFLEPIPAHVPAMGIEIDPEQAARARERTGRRIITADFRDVSFAERPTVFLGNPPFKTRLFDEFLSIAEKVMSVDGRIGMILPAFFFQTSGRVVRYNEAWGIATELLPRDLFPGLEKPLIFATFRKDLERKLIGFSLYHEQAFVKALPKDVGESLREGPRTWKEVVSDAIDAAGGVATLQQIYDYVADRRPSTNPHWKEQIRKVCQAKATRVDRAQYSMNFAA